MTFNFEQRINKVGKYMYVLYNVKQLYLDAFDYVKQSKTMPPEGFLFKNTVNIIFTCIKHCKPSQCVS